MPDPFQTFVGPVNAIAPLPGSFQPGYGTGWNDPITYSDIGRGLQAVEQATASLFGDQALSMISQANAGLNLRADIVAVGMALPETDLVLVAALLPMINPTTEPPGLPQNTVGSDVAFASISPDILRVSGFINRNAPGDASIVFASYTAPTAEQFAQARAALSAVASAFGMFFPSGSSSGTSSGGSSGGSGGGGGGGGPPG